MFPGHAEKRTQVLVAVVPVEDRRQCDVQIQLSGERGEFVPDLPEALTLPYGRRRELQVGEEVVQGGQWHRDEDLHVKLGVEGGRREEVLHPVLKVHFGVRPDLVFVQDQRKQPLLLHIRLGPPPLR